MAVTWDPVLSHDVILTAGNLTVEMDGATFNYEGLAIGTEVLGSAKVYWEIVVGAESTTIEAARCGLIRSVEEYDPLIGDTDQGWGFSCADGKFYHNDSGAVYGSTPAEGDTIGIAYDGSTGKLFFAINNVWQNSGNPETGANPAVSSLSGVLYPGYGGTDADATDACNTNFGDTSFTYTPPSGYAKIEEVPNPDEHVNIFTVKKTNFYNPFPILGGV